MQEAREVVITRSSLKPYKLEVQLNGVPVAFTDSEEIAQNWTNQLEVNGFIED